MFILGGHKVHCKMRRCDMKDLLRYLHEHYIILLILVCTWYFSYLHFTHIAVRRISVVAIYAKSSNLERVIRCG